MALTRSDETDILASLHAGPHEDAPWRVFLERLCRRLAADHAGLVISFPGGEVQRRFARAAAQGGGPDATADRLAALFGPADPLRLCQLRNGRVYGLADLLDPADPAQAVAMRDLALPAGAGQFRILRVTDPEGVSAWLWVARARGEFGGGTGAMLSSLAPHLTIALRSFVWVAQARRRAALADRLERAAGLGWIRFDAAGPVLDLSRSARDLLARIPGLRAVRGERMALPDPADGRALQRAIEAAARTGQAGALELSTRPRFELMLLAGDESSMDAFPGIAAVLRRCDGPGAGVMAGPLASLHGLGPSEARLTAELAAGKSLADAAASLGLTVETARTYSKRIFDKTGTRGQPDLIRLVLSGAAVLGQD